MNKHKPLIIGLAILLALTACGNENSKTQELATEISALETQITGLETALNPILVPPTTAPPTASPSDQPPTEISPTEIPPTEINSTQVATPKPTSTITPPSEAFTCGVVIASTPLYRESYTKTGKLRKNQSGYPILEVVPNYEVERYSRGEVVCYYKYAIQADGMSVFRISNIKGLGYYIPTAAVAGD